MKSFSVLFVLGALMIMNPAHAQRGGGETRGGGGETRGDSGGGSSGDTRGSSYETRGSSSSSSSGAGDYGSSSSSSCCDSGGSYGGDYSYGGGGGSSRARKIKIKDFRVGQKVELVETGDKGVITYLKKTLFGGWACIEFDVDHTEECGFKAEQMRGI